MNTNEKTGTKNSHEVCRACEDENRNHGPLTHRVNYPVPVHHASTRPLGTKKLLVLNLEMLETSMMA